MLETEANRRAFFKSSWFSEDKTVGALKEQLGVEHLDIEVVDTPLEQIKFVAKQRHEPIEIQMKLSRRMFGVIISINVLASALVPQLH